MIGQIYLFLLKIRTTKLGNGIKILRCPGMMKVHREKCIPV